MIYRGTSIPKPTTLMVKDSMKSETCPTVMSFAFRQTTGWGITDDEYGRIRIFTFVQTHSSNSTTMRNRLENMNDRGDKASDEIAAGNVM